MCAYTTVLMVNVAELAVLFKTYTHQYAFQVYSCLRRNVILTATIITILIRHLSPQSIPRRAATTANTETAGVDSTDTCSSQAAQATLALLPSSPMSFFPVLFFRANGFPSVFLPNFLSPVSFDQLHPLCVAAPLPLIF